MDEWREEGRRKEGGGKEGGRSREGDGEGGGDGSAVILTSFSVSLFSLQSI